MSDKKNILIVCPYPENTAPSQRLKYEQYFDSWRNNGFNIAVHPFYSNKTQAILYKQGYVFKKVAGIIQGYLQRILLLFSLRKYDLIYIHLWVTPLGFPFLERLFVLFNPRIIYDIDDAIFIKSESTANPYINWIKGRNKPLFLMKKAKHVITCTPYLTDVALKYNSKVTDISSTINTHTYQPVNTYQNDHKPVLGWSGSHSTSPFLYLLKDVLVELNKRKPFKLIVMGDANFKIDGLDIEALAWTEEIEIPTLQKFDIGLYPLPLNTDFVLGKSGLKALQYMAVGVPVVATGIGANYRIIRDGETGFLVKTPEEWLEKLELLIDSPSLRKTAGLAGRLNVVDNYSIDVTTPIYLAVLKSVS
jgi:glycosyltransferase involved in cell wall biosynthesis